MGFWTSRVRAVLAAAILASTPAAFADGPGPAQPNVAAPPVTTTPAPQTPAPQGRSGAIDLMNGAVHLNVPAGWLFYSADEAQAFLARNGAPAPSGTVLGLLAREDQRIDQPGAWASVVSFQNIGYVQSTTAGALAAPTLEADVRAARTQQQRRFEGFAAPPAFTPASADLTWAERVAAPGAGGKDMRYEGRKLGRNGVVALTSIGSADQQPAMAAAAPEMLAMISFGTGQAYTDFVQGDRVSTFTLPALVTGVEPVAPAPVAQQPQESGQTGWAGLSGWFPVIAFGVIALAIGGYALTRRRRSNFIPEE